MSATHEQLLGYLLGALEDEERRAVDEALRRDPDLRRQLTHVRERLAPLEASWRPVCPPPGLWQRTCRAVRVSARVVPGELARRSGAWRLRDAAAVAVVLMLAVALLFPALSAGRFRAALRGCQFNLGQLGLAIRHYGGLGDGSVPQAPLEGNEAFAGVFAAQLYDHGLLSDGQWLVCPGAPDAKQRQIRLIGRQELRTAEPLRLVELRRQLAGDYGYHLGTVVGGRALPLRIDQAAVLALMADEPGPLGQVGLNHGGRMHNVLHLDGSVRTLVVRIGPGGDDLFLNDDGEVAPGRRAEDSVVAPPLARPVHWIRLPSVAP